MFFFNAEVNQQIWSQPSWQQRTTWLIKSHQENLTPGQERSGHQHSTVPSTPQVLGGLGAGPQSSPAALRVWQPHHPPLGDEPQATSSLLSGSSTTRGRGVFSSEVSCTRSVVCKLWDCFSTWIKAQWAQMIRRVASEAFFWSEQKVSTGSPRGGLERDGHTRDWATAWFHCTFFSLKIIT